MSSSLYRSAGLTPGSFRRLESLHVHVDGAGSIATLMSLIEMMESRGSLSKVTRVSECLPGEQRLLLPETYASHTPGTESEEQFDFFTTSTLTDRAEAVSVIRMLIPSLHSYHGSVVEVEQVVATILDGRLAIMPSEVCEPITSWEVGFDKGTTAPYEIHHGIDIEIAHGPVPPLQLIAKELASAGLLVGGWFSFQKKDKISYRSSAFTTSHNFHFDIQAQHDLIGSYLASGPCKHAVWTIAERVIGIWKEPFKPAGR